MGRGSLDLLDPGGVVRKEGICLTLLGVSYRCSVEADLLEGGKPQGVVCGLNGSGFVPGGGLFLDGFDDGPPFSGELVEVCHHTRPHGRGVPPSDVGIGGVHFGGGIEAIDHHKGHFCLASRHEVVMVEILQAEGDGLPIREGDVHGVPDVEQFPGGPSLSHGVDVCGLHCGKAREYLTENADHFHGKGIRIGGVCGLDGDCPVSELARVHGEATLCVRRAGEGNIPLLEGHGGPGDGLEVEDGGCGVFAVIQVLPEGGDLLLELGRRVLVQNFLEHIKPVVEILLAILHKGRNVQLFHEAAHHATNIVVWACVPDIACGNGNGRGRDGDLRKAEVVIIGVAEESRGGGGCGGCSPDKDGPDFPLCGVHAEDKAVDPGLGGPGSDGKAHGSGVLVEVALDPRFPHAQGNGKAPRRRYSERVLGGDRNAGGDNVPKK